VSDRYRVGIIGLGRVARELEEDALRPKPCSHAGGWLSRNEVTIVAGCDVDAGRRQAFGEHVGVTALYEDYREMLANEHLDFVSVCAYATERCAMVTAAAEAGVRGIWCEKAAATSLAEMDRMAEVLERHDTQLIVSYMRRWENRYRCLKTFIDEDGLGRLQTVNVHFTGNMLHTGTHAFDLLRMLVGEVGSVQAWLREDDGRPLQSGYRYGGDEAFQDYGGNVVLHFENGITAMIHGEIKDYFRFEFELLGTKGMVRVGNTQQEYWSVGDSRYSAGLLELQQDTFPIYQGNNIWTEAVGDLISAVETGQRVACGIKDARAALAISLAMHQSQARGNAVVNVAEVPSGLEVRSR